MNTCCSQTAMRDLLQRYPDENTGLGSWNEILLRNVEAQAHRDKLSYAIGHAMGTYKSADTMGDIAMFKRIIEMTEDQHPLIHIEGSWEHGMRACQGSVTPVGHAVLAGKKNAVKLNGIDEWIGGVHLTDNNVILRRGTDLLL